MNEYYLIQCEEKINTNYLYSSKKKKALHGYEQINTQIWWHLMGSRVHFVFRSTTTNEKNCLLLMLEKVFFADTLSRQCIVLLKSRTAGRSPEYRGTWFYETTQNYTVISLNSVFRISMVSFSKTQSFFSSAEQCSINTIWFVRRCFW